MSKLDVFVPAVTDWVLCQGDGALVVFVDLDGVGEDFRVDLVNETGQPKGFAGGFCCSDIFGFACRE